MAFASRSSVFAFVKEVTEGVPVEPTADDFTVVREGASLTGAVNSVTSDELRNSIGASKSFVTSQAPTGSIPKYLKPSGIEGVPPDYSILIESCLGGMEVNATEYSTVPGSTAGDAATRATLLVSVGTELNFKPGEGLLIKDAVNNYAVRNVWAGSTPGVIPISFNLGVAPGGGVGLGKAVFFYPTTSQPTFTAHMWQASVNSAIHQMIAGARTTGMAIEFTANELAAVTFDFGGIAYYVNPVTIGLTTRFIDFTDSVGTVAAELDQMVYPTPIDLAAAIASKMTGASAASGGDTISVRYDNMTGKFVISTDGATLSLLFGTGANLANSAASALGFTATDHTGATSYTSENAQVLDPLVTPDYDDSSPQVVRDSMLEFGTFADFLCLSGQALTITISTPKTDVPDWCSPTGIGESVILSREVTISGTIRFAKGDVQRFYNLINNQDTQLSFVNGKRVSAGGNWIPGSIVNVFCPTCSITSDTIVDQDGYIVEQFEATAFVGPDMEDVYINFL